MDSKEPRPEGADVPGFGIVRDLTQLKTHGSASVAELREFLAQTRGRGPQEVLGMLAGSHLLRNVALATVAALAIFVVGTIIPWWMGLASPDNQSSAKTPAAAKTAASAPVEAKQGGKSPAEQPVPHKPAAPTVPAAEAKVHPSDADKAVKVMGLGETKVADPKKNPLEKGLDNLLDKLE
jgi:hypothetical protein